MIAWVELNMVVRRLTDGCELRPGTACSDNRPDCRAALRVIRLPQVRSEARLLPNREDRGTELLPEFLNRLAPDTLVSSARDSVIRMSSPSS